MNDFLHLSYNQVEATRQQQIALTANARQRPGAIQMAKERIKRNERRLREWKKLLRNPSHLVPKEAKFFISSMSELQSIVAKLQQNVTDDLVLLHRLRRSADGGCSHYYSKSPNWNFIPPAIVYTLKPRKVSA